MIVVAPRLSAATDNLQWPSPNTILWPLVWSTHVTGPAPPRPCPTAILCRGLVVCDDLSLLCLMMMTKTQLTLIIWNVQLNQVQ